MWAMTKPSQRGEVPADPAIPVALLSLGTAVPETVLTQEEAKAIARKVFGHRSSQFERLAPVFDNAGIEQRHIVRPPEWYEGEHGWRARNDVYLEAAESLYEQAARRALEAAGVKAGEVANPRPGSTPGLPTPSLQARAAGREGLPAEGGG